LKGEEKKRRPKCRETQSPKKVYAKDDSPPAPITAINDGEGSGDEVRRKSRAGAQFTERRKEGLRTEQRRKNKRKKVM
jgi:hypothetical protein